MVLPLLQGSRYVSSSRVLCTCWYCSRMQWRADPNCFISVVYARLRNSSVPYVAALVTRGYGCYTQTCSWVVGKRCVDVPPFMISSVQHSIFSKLETQINFLSCFFIQILSYIQLSCFRTFYSYWGNVCVFCVLYKEIWFNKIKRNG